MLYIFCLLCHKVYSWLPALVYYFHFHFCKQEICCCSDDASRTGEQNVNLDKNALENVASNKMIVFYCLVVHFKMCCYAILFNLAKLVVSFNLVKLGMY